MTGPAETCRCRHLQARRRCLRDVFLLLSVSLAAAAALGAAALASPAAVHPGGGGGGAGDDDEDADMDDGTKVRDLFSDAIAALGALLALPWALPLAAVLSGGTLLALALSEAVRRRHPSNAWAAFGGGLGSVRIPVAALVQTCE